jgi:hypothetical protein
LSVDIIKDKRDRQSQVKHGDRHISTRRSHRMCHEVSEICQKLCKRSINSGFCDDRIRGILSEQEIGLGLTMPLSLLGRADEVIE